jgi:hypothetical protein
MRKKSCLFIVSLLIVCELHAQDGSNIIYKRVKQLGKSDINRFVHLDFYRNSFRTKSRDTIIINFGNKPIKFIEHRQDDGYNNWFREQYLESVKNEDGTSIRITQSCIDRIRKDTLYVTNYYEFFDKEMNPIAGKSEIMKGKYPTKIIYGVLIDADRKRLVRHGRYRR